MSGRIERCFEQARARGRTVLVPFMTAGDPDPDRVVALMHGLVEGGADLLELGIPFSDPMADGPVIQASSERAIERGVNLQRVLKWVSDFRQGDADTPVVLMGYMNPFERFGVERLAPCAAEAGVDGVLTVDCPPEEMGRFGASLNQAGLASIRLVAPTTPADRLATVTRDARGFIYYVSFKGTTGAGHLDTDALAAPLARLRAVTSLPVAVGFGISDAAAARGVAEHADAVVIGSALVQRLANCGTGAETVKTAVSFMQQVRAELDRSA